MSIASASCPMAAAAAPGLKALFRRFGDRVSFLTLYVREAHPGESLRQAADLEDKFDNAHRLQRRDRLPWPIAIDGLDGDVHARLGSNSNAVYLVGPDGRVLFRALWSSEGGALARALERAVRGEPGPYGESRRSAAPLLRGLGCLSETVADAGRDAERDLRRRTPAAYALGKIAGAFTPLSPLSRGVAAVAVAGLAAGLTASALRGRRRA